MADDLASNNTAPNINRKTALKMNFRYAWGLSSEQTREFRL